MIREEALMTTVEVFDPPMCCSTGVCGPSVDPALATFASDLSWLADQGTSVERHNLSQEPKAFAESDLVRQLLAERGDEALPAVVVDGELRSSGRIPTRSELAGWSLVAAPPDTLDPVTTELVALGAAVGANCEPCFTSHFNEARRLGIGSDVMAEAVRVAQAVKDTPAHSILDLAVKLLDADAKTLSRGDAVDAAPATDTAEATAGGCCGGAATSSGVDPTAETVVASSGCCGGDASTADVPAVATASGTSGCC
jgi:AhpD family alkylhydroperoxidase